MSDALKKPAAAERQPQEAGAWRADPMIAAVAARCLPLWRGEPRVAVLIPCFNEEAAIAKVVTDFRAALPQARIYVYDNASTDRTAAEARGAGAIVRNEALRG